MDVRVRKYVCMYIDGCGRRRRQWEMREHVCVCLSLGVCLVCVPVCLPLPLVSCFGLVVSLYVRPSPGGSGSVNSPRQAPGRRWVKMMSPQWSRSVAG